MTNILAILPSRNEQAPPHPKTVKLRLSASVRLPGPSRVPAAGSGASRSPGSSNLNRRSQSFNSIDKGKPLQYASGNDRGESRGEHIIGPHRRNEGRVRVMPPSILNPGHLVAPRTQAGGLKGCTVCLSLAEGWSFCLFNTKSDCFFICSFFGWGLSDFLLTVFIAMA